MSLYLVREKEHFSVFSERRNISLYLVREKEHFSVSSERKETFLCI